MYQQTWQIRILALVGGVADILGVRVIHQGFGLFARVLQISLIVTLLIGALSSCRQAIFLIVGVEQALFRLDSTLRCPRSAAP